MDALTEAPKSKPAADPLRLTRRRFLHAAAGTAFAAVALDGLLVDPQNVHAEDLTITLERLPAAFDGFRIAQLSDIHYGETIGDSYVHRAVEIANSFAPDMVVITGDFTTRSFTMRNPEEAARRAEPCARVLTGLRSRLGTVAILGNHDVDTDPVIVTRALESNGIRMLNNEAYSIEQNAARLWIAGLGDVFFGRHDLNATMHNVPDDEAVIMLVHEPDYADAVANFRRVDLQLSGHSHGGQVRVPGLGPIPFVLPYLGRKYINGLFHIRGAAGHLQLYTNRGLGTVGIPVRFNCTPEVTRITLRSKRP